MLRPGASRFRPQRVRQVRSVIKFPRGCLSRPCARMETAMGGFVLGVTTTLCVLLVGSMMAFGPHILEWIENSEQG